MSEVLQEPVPAETPYISGFIMKDGTPGHTGTGPSPETGPEDNDRPGWIPPEILHNWNTDPYAYQTEEEMMPGGGPHGCLLGYIMGISDDFLAAKNLMFLMDVFMLYRDRQGVKQRVSPDLLLMPFRSDVPHAYDLDTEPLPLLLAEITSPESREDDTGKKFSLYADLRIPAYLVIDQVTSRGKLRKRVRLHLWRRINGRFRKIQAEAGGWLTVREAGLKIKYEGRKIIMADIVTGEILLSAGQIRALRKQEEALRKQEEALLKQETARVERMAAKLRELGISPDEL